MKTYPNYENRERHSRAFEGTRDNRIVWEFTNPQRAGDEKNLIAAIYEMLRIDPGQLPFLGEETGGAKTSNRWFYPRDLNFLTPNQPNAARTNPQDTRDMITPIVQARGLKTISTRCSPRSSHTPR